MLSEKQLEHVCLLYGGHKQCRYLDGDTNDYTKWFCKKKTPIKDEIDEEVEFYRKAGSLDSSLPVGDNCDGFMNFKELLQGYDVEEV